MKYAAVLAFAVSTCLGSPIETRGVMKDFHESLEVTFAFGDRIVKNGDKLPWELVQTEPTIGHVCGSSVGGSNFTAVLVDNEVVANSQRAMFVIGNMPGGDGGTVKLSYVAPPAAAVISQDTRHVYVLTLFQMSGFIPRWKAGECTENRGLKLDTPPCPPNTPSLECPAGLWVADDNCVGWNYLPKHSQRNGFNTQQFAEANNLTAVDILWFEVIKDDAAVQASNGPALATQPKKAPTAALTMVVSSDGTADDEKAASRGTTIIAECTRSATATTTATVAGTESTATPISQALTPA